jgi:prevent-host-death family protein
MKVASAAEMKSNFGAYLKASADGPVVVTLNGKAVAVLVSVNDESELERLAMAHSPRLQQILGAARQRIEAGAGIPGDAFWSEMERGKEPKKRPAKRKKSP